MDCQSARELHVAALVAGRSPSDDVGRHVAGCADCRDEVRGLAAAWTALGSLPLLEPSPRVGRSLRRRIRWELARAALGSLESWQRAALAGVAGFAVSVALSLVVPYQTMVALCQGIAPEGMPAAAAYLAAGLLYGLLPMAVASALPPRGQAFLGPVGLVQAGLVFLLVLVPYVILACEEFPPPLLAGFVGGIALGATLGGAAGAAGHRRLLASG